MMDRDIILEKINSIQRCLSTIHRATANNINALDDVIIQDAVVLNIQRAVQLCIDMASYLIAHFKWGLPATLKECFLILQDNKVLTSTITEKMVKMIGFRNVVVYEYQKLNISILKSIVKDHLSDFEEFYSDILNYLDKKHATR
jgi:uncharacterized protein YutE (UPF0331/DUF86 family)